MVKKYYIDSCIWLNLFKKEGDPSKGSRSYWKIAKDFIESVLFSDKKEIIYSGFVLKELKFKLSESLFKEKLRFLKGEEKFKFAKAIEGDYALSRNLEEESDYEISFFDCLHIALCKRLNLILVTRDADLIEFAQKYILVVKPEDLI